MCLAGMQKSLLGFLQVSWLSLFLQKNIRDDIKDLCGLVQVKGRHIVVLGVVDNLVVTAAGDVGVCCQTLLADERAHSSQVSIVDD